ncbi:hypothetical protein ASD65_11480 [Microbacterium sp. Root61]|uniref:tryptophan-rich sensory protein n=1 Tax=Microbacterium sp. Root61 TaxID=1736570 RepID=UPI0006F81666|nr:tryptophan-rich sensory protein [Microbacterium sp. Root61]KRA24977.1 hypothetical protein ASD65_11480 [Microbacterium sp. Root61]
MDTDIHTTSRATRADRARQIAVVVGGLVALVGAMAGSGVFGGTRVQDASDGALSATATVIAPAGPAFAIWSVIYAGLIGYSVWQLLPRQAQRDRHRRTGWWILTSQLLNAAWILSVQAGPLWLSVIVIVALLSVLALIFVRLQRIRSAGWQDAVVMDGTIGLYLGWVMVATIANITAWLVALGFNGFGWSEDAWGIIVLSAGTAVSVAVSIWSRGRLTPAVATAWGFAWISVGRLTSEPPSAVVGVAAAIAAGVALAVAVIARLAGPPPR